MEKSTLILIVGMAVVTGLTRSMPFLVLAGKELPPFFLQWLRFVPVSVLSAMLFPEVFVKRGQLNLSISNHFLWATLFAVAIGVWRRNLILTVFAALGSLIVLRTVIN